MFCSFCGREENHSIQLVEGASGSICGDCAEIAIGELDAESFNKKDSNSLLKPHQIKYYLYNYIVGQDEAKKMLAVNVYNHYKRLNRKTRIPIQKSNMLLIGASGTGKTYMIQTLANLLDVPLVIADATQYTEAGYVGEDVETILSQLFQKANGDIEMAERGIVYIDEVDKISSFDASDGSKSKDVGKRGVQEAFLKLIEGQEFLVHHNAVRAKLSTENVLFIFGGAFVGLDKIVAQRSGKREQKRIGFSQSEVPPLKTPQVSTSQVTTDDLVQFGLIPEFVGRIPIISTLNLLTKDDLIHILTKPKHAIIKQYQALFRMDGIQLRFNKEALNYIAEKAIEQKTGARGLKAVIEGKMYDLMFELPMQDGLKSISITKDMLESGDWFTKNKRDGRSHRQ